MKNFQEKFEVNSYNSPFFSKQFDILITGSRDEDNKRHTHFRSILTLFQGNIYTFDTCENADKLFYKIEDCQGQTIEQVSNKSLVPDLEQILKLKGFDGKRVCIDITSLKQGILFLLVKLLTSTVKPSILFAGYTEPTQYKKRKVELFEANEEFDLYENLIGSFKSVPGFVKHKSSKSILLVASIGFDSQRLQTIYENLKPKKLIPVVGFPSFIPGWNLTAIKMNYMVIKDSDCTDMVESCEAASPFAFYEMLKEFYHQYISDYDIYIAPLGTRPHCLGAALFASNFPSVYLVYDFPVEKSFRSEDILKADLFHISKYIL